MGFYYGAYGLSLWCDFSLPTLAEQSETSWVDLRIFFKSAPSVSEAATNWRPHSTLYSRRPEDVGDDPTLCVLESVDAQFIRLVYGYGITFTFSADGSQLWVKWPLDDVPLEAVIAYLMNPVLGFYLRLRGNVCLHASAIAIDDEVILVSGPAGYGKSTTASLFAVHGHTIFTDDIALLTRHNNHVEVTPGYPGLRLWPESAQQLLGRDDLLPELAPGWTKQYLDLNNSQYPFANTPLRIGAIYILRRRESQMRIEPAPPSSALLDLMNNTYMDYLLDAERRSLDFKLLAWVVGAVPVRYVTPHFDLARLSELYEGITSDFHSMVKA